MPARERPCLEHVQRCPGLLVAFSLSLVSFKTGGHKPETKLRTFAAQAMGTFTPAARVLSWSSNSPDPLLVPNNDKPKLSTSAKLGFPFSANTPPAQTGVNCRGFFGLLFSYPFGLFIPRVLDT